MSPLYPITIGRVASKQGLQPEPWRYGDPRIEWAVPRCQGPRLVSGPEAVGSINHLTMGPVELEPWKHSLAWHPDQYPNSRESLFIFIFLERETWHWVGSFSPNLHISEHFFSHPDKPAIPTAHTGGRAPSAVCVGFLLPGGSSVKLTHFLWPLKKYPKSYERIMSAKMKIIKHQLKATSRGWRSHQLPVTVAGLLHLPLWSPSHPKVCSLTTGMEA